MHSKQANGGATGETVIVDGAVTGALDTTSETESTNSHVLTDAESTGPTGSVSSENESRPSHGDGELPGTGGGLPSAFGASGAGEGIAADPAAPGIAPTAGAPTPAPGAPILPPVDDTSVSPTDDNNVPVEPGTLTAGAWDDNLNFSHFLDYRQSIVEQGTDGRDGALEFAQAEHEAAFESLEPTPHQKLDISLVIDTTGSMGDELSYLQAEFLSISERIEASYPDADQRWSLVVYKDENDPYVVRWFDFRDDANDFRTHLAAQSPGGGDDFPEASHAALAVMNQLSWRTDDVTARLAFWVADAPHHGNAATDMKQAIKDAQSQGIHLYPVASSGVDELTEFSMRSAAQLTGGRYLFLTDDSGVGNEHKQPTIPCYFVTRLDHALLRMVAIEMSGVRTEPASNEIIRAVGAPENGACQLSDAGALIHVL